jgi:hypothetical protein
MKELERANRIGDFSPLRALPKRRESGISQN